MCARAVAYGERGRCSNQLLLAAAEAAVFVLKPRHSSVHVVRFTCIVARYRVCSLC